MCSVYFNTFHCISVKFSITSNLPWFYSRLYLIITKTDVSFVAR